MKNVKSYLFRVGLVLLAGLLSNVAQAQSDTNIERKEGPQVVIITGTASGFGKATAEKLVAKGHIVYGGDINVEGNQYLNDIGGHALEMDVTDDAQVQAGIERIISEQGRIDVLINNAGYGEFATIENIKIEDLKHQFDVNVFGYARLQQAVLPHMRKQRSGRVIIVSSVIGKFSLPMLGWYSSTKHAVEGMADAL
ncbi:MAG: SDR family NAD(P)-dependent oxidoreductase, partial [Bacteroidota bacterium]